MKNYSKNTMLPKAASYGPEMVDEPMRPNIENVLAQAWEALDSCHMTLGQIDQILMPTDGPENIGVPQCASRIGLASRADMINNYAMDALKRLQDLRDRLGN